MKKNLVSENEGSLVIECDFLGIPVEIISGLLHERESLREKLDEEEGSNRNSFKRHLLNLLVVKDDFEKVFAYIDASGEIDDEMTDSLIGNFRKVHKRLKILLEDEQVIEMDVLGQEHDRHCHKVVETVSGPPERAEEIIEVRKKGYMWGDMILRKPEVVIIAQA